MQQGSCTTQHFTLINQAAVNRPCISGVSSYRGLANPQVAEGDKALSEANKVLNPPSGAPTRGGLPTCRQWPCVVGPVVPDVSNAWPWNAGTTTLRNAGQFSPTKQRHSPEDWRLLKSNVIYKRVTLFRNTLQHRSGPPYLISSDV